MGDDSGYLPPPPPPPPPPPGGVPGSLPQRGVWEVIQAAFEIYRQNAAQLITIVAIVVVPLQIIGFLIVRVALAPTSRTVEVAGQSVRIVNSRGFFVALLAFLVAVAVAIIISAILQAAILRAAALATIGDPIDVEASYRWGLRRVWSVIWVAFLMGLATIIGVVGLFIGALIVAVFVSVSVPALVVEDLRGTAALRRSWGLVRHHFWHAVGIIVVAAILTGIVSGIFSAIGSGNRVVGAILSIIAQVIVAPFSALVSVLLYLDLRARVESLTPTRLREELQSGSES
jgi:hypothetical protein